MQKNVLGFAVTTLSKEMEYKGKPVMEAWRYTNYREQVMVVIGTSSKYHSEIINYLSLIGLYNIYKVNEGTVDCFLM